MSLRRVFHLGSSSKEIGRASRRRSRSTRLRLFVDRLEEHLAPNVLAPGSLAIGLEAGMSAAAAGAATSALVGSAVGRGHDGIVAMRSASVHGPFAGTDHVTGRHGHPSSEGHAREAAGTVHRPRAGGSRSRIGAFHPKGGAHEESPRLKAKAPHDRNSGSVVMPGRGSPSPTTPASRDRGAPSAARRALPPAAYPGPGVPPPSAPRGPAAGVSLPTPASGNGPAGGPGASGVAASGPAPSLVSAPPPAASSQPPAEGGAGGTV